MKDVADWQSKYDLDDIERAKTILPEVVKFWKTYQNPGKRCDMVLRTHYVALVGCAVNRKIWVPTLCLIMARKLNNKELPAFSPSV